MSSDSEMKGDDFSLCKRQPGRAWSCKSLASIFLNEESNSLDFRSRPADSPAASSRNLSVKAIFMSGCLHQIPPYIGSEPCPRRNAPLVGGHSVGVIGSHPVAEHRIGTLDSLRVNCRAELVRPIGFTHAGAHGEPLSVRTCPRLEWGAPKRKNSG